MSKLPVLSLVSWASQAVPLLAYIASRRRTAPAAALLISWGIYRGPAVSKFTTVE